MASYHAIGSTRLNSELRMLFMRRLGHADVVVTMRVYQHVTAQDDHAMPTHSAGCSAGARPEVTGRHHDPSAI